MMQINIYESDIPLSQLVARVIAGEEVTISGKEGNPLAKIVHCESSNPPRRLGIWRGKVKMADDFDELPEEFAKAFGVS